MGFAKQVAYNTLVQIVGKFIVAGLSLAVIAFLTRYLGVTGYGDYTTATVFISFFAIFADFGINLIVVREISKNAERTADIIANVLGLKLFFSLFVLLLAPLLALFLPYSNIIKLSILILASGTYFLSLNQVFVGVFQSRLKLDRAVFADIIGRLVILLLTLLFLYLGLGLPYIILAILLGNLINLITSWFLIRQMVRVGLKFNFGVWKKIFLESLSMGLVLVLGVTYYRIGPILLSLFKGSYDVGIYGAAYKLFEFLVILPALFAGTVFPLLSRFLGEVNRERFRSIFQKSFDLLVIAGLPVALGGILLAPYIINLIAGSGYENSVLVFKLLSLTLLFIFLTQLSGTTIVSIGKQKKLILPYIICVIFSIGANLVLIPRYSYLGAGLVTLLTEILVLLFGYFILFAEIRLLPELEVSKKTILATGLLGIFLWLVLKFNLIINWTNFQSYPGFVKLISFFGLILLAAIFYLVILYLLKGYSKETVLALLKREKYE